MARGSLLRYRRQIRPRHVHPKKVNPSTHLAVFNMLCRLLKCLQHLEKGVDIHDQICRQKCWAGSLGEGDEVTGRCPQRAVRFIYLNPESKGCKANRISWTYSEVISLTAKRWSTNRNADLVCRPHSAGGALETNRHKSGTH